MNDQNNTTTNNLNTSQNNAVNNTQFGLLSSPSGPSGSKIIDDVNNSPRIPNFTMVTDIDYIPTDAFNMDEMEKQRSKKSTLEIEKPKKQKRVTIMGDAEDLEENGAQQKPEYQSPLKDKTDQKRFSILKNQGEQNNIIANLNPNSQSKSTDSQQITLSKKGITESNYNDQKNSINNNEKKEKQEESIEDIIKNKREKDLEKQIEQRKLIEKEYRETKSKGGNNDQPPQSSSKAVVCVVMCALAAIGTIVYLYIHFNSSEVIETRAFSNSDPVMEGYDVVEYFKLERGGQGVKGQKKFQVKYDNAYFWFKSEENKKSFQNNTDKYIPMFGGFDPDGILNPEGAPWKKSWLGPGCDPKKGWAVYKDKLYCCFSLQTAFDFFSAKDAEQKLKKVENIWIKWFGSLGGKSGYFNNRCYNYNQDVCVKNQQDFKQGKY